MANVQTKVVGDKLVIEVDISNKARKDAPLSSSGKNKTVGTTNGFLPVEGTGGVRVSLNVIAPK